MALASEFNSEASLGRISTIAAISAGSLSGVRTLNMGHLGLCVVEEAPMLTKMVDQRNHAILPKRHDLSSASRKRDDCLIPIDKSSNASFADAASGKAIRMLVIDNDEQHLIQMRELFSPTLLRRKDVSFCYCSNASDAMELIEEIAFDLLLIDYHMPGVDGLKFLEYLSKNEHKCDRATKVLMTADSSLPDQVRRKVLAYSATIMNKGITASDARDLIRKASLKSVS
jgi:two-component system chemotaxis response regulator CheY